MRGHDGKSVSEIPFSREEKLRKRLNAFLAQSLCLPEQDYYASLTAKGILELKSVLADINNILTLKVSLAFVDWVAARLELPTEIKHTLRATVLEASPNANGFDVWLSYPIPFIAEVKCNVPINRSSRYGAAQRQGIEKDIDALLTGKLKASIDAKSCVKFMAFLDTPEIRSANGLLIRSSLTCKDRLLFAPDDAELNRYDVVYGAYVSPGA